MSITLVRHKNYTEYWEIKSRIPEKLKLLYMKHLIALKCNLNDENLLEKYAKDTFNMYPC